MLIVAPGTTGTVLTDTGVSGRPAGHVGAADAVEAAPVEANPMRQPTSPARTAARRRGRRSAIPTSQPSTDQPDEAERDEDPGPVGEVDDALRRGVGLQGLPVVGEEHR